MDAKRRKRRVRAAAAGSFRTAGPYAEAFAGVVHGDAQLVGEGWSLRY